MITTVTFKGYSSAFEVSDMHCVRVEGSENCDWFCVPEDIQEQMSQMACDVYDNGLSIVLDQAPNLPEYWFNC